MLTVTSNYSIFWPQCRHHPGSDRLLAYIHVTKTSNFLLRIHHKRSLFKSPHKQHHMVPFSVRLFVICLCSVRLIRFAPVVFPICRNCHVYCSYLSSKDNLSSRMTKSRVMPGSTCQFQVNF